MLLSLTLSAALAGNPLGTDMPEAVTVDITDDGFDALSALVQSLDLTTLVPPLPDQSFSDDTLLYDYDISISNITVDIAIGDVTIDPNTGVLDVALIADVAIGSSFNPIILDVDASGLGFINVSGDCDAWVGPVTATVNGSMQIYLDPVTGQLVTDTSLPFNSSSLALTGDDVNVQNCTAGDVIGGINSVLGFLGLDDIYDLIINTAINPQLDGAIGDLGAVIDDSVGPAFSSLEIAQTIDLLGTPLDIEVYPSDLYVEPEGLRITLGGRADLPGGMDPCVEKYGIVESKSTTSAFDPLGSYPYPGSVHAAVAVDDDLVNQILFAVWAGGLLCYDLDSDALSELGVPIPLDTNFFLNNLLAPDVFATMFVETQPMKLVTDPTTPPELYVGGDNDLNVTAPDLGLDLYVEYEDREIRLLGLTLDADIGIDLDFDPTTGNLGLDVGLDAGAIQTTVDYNEFRPESSGLIEEQFSSVFDTLVGPLAGSLLAGLEFALPSLDIASLAGGPPPLPGDPVDAFGLQSANVAAAGEADDKLGLYATIGAVEYGSAGCAEDGSCSSGCSTSNAPGQLLLIIPGLLALLRRRRN